MVTVYQAEKRICVINFTDFFSYCAESAECSDGALRLVSDSGISTESGVGRLEICYQGVWGAVYDANWTAIDAAVTCQEFGFDPRGIYVHGTRRHVYCILCDMYAYRFTAIGICCILL